MPNAWIGQVFKAKQVTSGGIVRRSAKSVLENATEAELIAEVKKRKFHMILVGTQYVIYCRNDVTMIC